MVCLKHLLILFYEKNVLFFLKIVYNYHRVIKMTYQYIIIIVVFIVLLLAVLKINKKDVKLDMNKLVEYLGGKDNIIDSETHLSRFIVTLKDISIVNKDGIVGLGAKGIVELDNQLKIILGPNSKQLKKYIEAMK